MDFYQERIGTQILVSTLKKQAAFKIDLGMCKVFQPLPMKRKGGGAIEKEVQKSADGLISI